jgi:hypothetical protein
VGCVTSWPAAWYVCLNPGPQGFVRAPLAIKMTLAALWTNDVEGHIREARDRLVEVTRALAIQEEMTRRTAAAAQAEEVRGDAIISRLALEAEIQAELRGRIKYARDRAAKDSVKAEEKEGILAHTKVLGTASSFDALW